MELNIFTYGVSQANKFELIDGNTYDFGLTRQTTLEILEFFRSYRHSLAGTTQIVCNGRKANYQAAQIFATILSTPVTIDKSLDEYRPGILEGLSYHYARSNFPDYFQKWQLHENPQGTPGAEAANEIQARIILFLQRYIAQSRSDGKTLIVTSPRVAKIILNTINMQPLFTPVDLTSSELYTIANPWAKISFQRYLNTYSNVYKVMTADNAFILKYREYSSSDQPDLFQKILDGIHSSEDNITPKVLAWDLRHNNDQDSTDLIQILDFLPGEHKSGLLNDFDTSNIFEMMHRIAVDLQKISTPSLTSVWWKFISFFETLPESKIRDIGKSILADNYVVNLFTNPNQVLVDMDTHRQNILFDGNKVRKIDPDFVFAPRSFQVGCLITDSFLFEHPNEFSLNKYLTIWPEQASTDEVLAAMLVRAFIGASYFENKISEDIHAANTIEKEYLDRYLRILEIIEGLRTKNIPA